MSGHGLGVFVICPLEACTGSFVCTSGVGTMPKHNMQHNVQSGYLGLETDRISCLEFYFLSNFIFGQRINTANYNPMHVLL